MLTLKYVWGAHFLLFRINGTFIRFDKASFTTFSLKIRLIMQKFQLYNLIDINIWQVSPQLR